MRRIDSSKFRMEAQDAIDVQSKELCVIQRRGDTRYESDFVQTASDPCDFGK